MKALVNAYNDLCIRTFVFLKSEKGQGVLEYGLVITAVSLAVLAALGTVSSAIKTRLNSAVQIITK